MISPYTSHNLYLLPSVQITNTPGEMASYLENVYLMPYISLLVTTEIAFIAGSVTHVFIIAVNVIDWRKGGTMSTSDQVIISIMISRIILQSVIQLNLFWKLLCTMCSPIHELVIRITYFSAMYSSFWLSTLLCVIFFLKISNFRSVFLVQLRIFFSKRILHLIFSSLLVSFSQNVLNSLVIISTALQVVSLNSTETAQPPFHAIYAVFYASTFVLLLIYLLSSLFLITSLYLHIKHMRCNRAVTSSLDVYYRIIKYTAGSLFTSVFSVIISVLVEKYDNVFGFLLFSFSWTTFGTLHSLLLIYVTPKLKNQFSRILKDLSICWVKREEQRDLAMTVAT